LGAIADQVDLAILLLYWMQLLSVDPRRRGSA